jgi:hypothetical protein
VFENDTEKVSESELNDRIIGAYREEAVK